MDIASHDKLALGVAVLCLAAASTVPAQDAGGLASRLARLERRLEAERTRLHIPGLAIAVVKDDEIIFKRGFGHADIATERPVTPETIFAVGSTTKAFTATLIGMLADDSKAGWDDPVTKHVPQFRLQIDTGGRDVTLRDLLCHRTGFTRMGVLWAGGRLTRNEVLEHAAAAKPFGRFRKQFLYSNVMYMTAGHAAGVAGGSDWPSLTASRILQPLGMTASSTSIEVAQKDRRLAKGYVWDEHERAFRRLPMRNLDLVGAAGGINSNVVDMAQWVRFQLGRGVHDGKRLLSAQAHAETWKPQIRMAPGVEYGLGWMLRHWNGERVVEHGGSIDGFAAQVSLLPGRRLGYVLLANVSATPLQQGSIGLVFGALQGDGETASDLPANLDGLVGKYVADFASFRDARLTVLMKSGKLALQLPGQGVFELQAPDSDGRWHLTGRTAVSFAVGADGRSRSLTMHESGMAFECVREGVAIAPEVPLAKMRPLVGAYRDPKSGRRIDVMIVNNRLVLDEQRGGRYQLAAPGDDGKWPMRANRKRLQVRFNRDEGGAIGSMSRFQRGREVRMPRVAAAAGASLPPVAAVLAKIRSGYGAEALAELGDVRMVGEVAFLHQGVRGKVTQSISGRRLAAGFDLGKVGSLRTVYDGKRGRHRSTFGPSMELHGPELAQLRRKHPLWVLHGGGGALDNAVVVGSAQIAGEQAWLLRLSAEGVPDRTIAVSAERGLILREKTVEIAPGLGRFPVTFAYSDYRPVRGVMVPFRVVSKTQQTGEIVIRFEDVSHPELGVEEFRLTLPKAKR